MANPPFTDFPPDPRDPLTLRFARSVRETTRDRRDWWEACERDTGLVVEHDGDPPKVSYRDGPPMRTAPHGFEAALQRELLRKPDTDGMFPTFRFIGRELVWFVGRLLSIRRSVQ